MEISYPPGATPLEKDEMAGLLPNDITTQGELNAIEQEGIAEARAKYFSKKGKFDFKDTFLRKVHKEMFKNVWKWAGAYRKSRKSIGVESFNISMEVHNLLKDTEFWIQNNSYPWDEIGVRFHHKLVYIHPFPNGNGRHARFMTDLLLYSFDQPIFSWGAKTLGEDLINKTKIRGDYIEALRAADKKDYSRLKVFVKS